MVKQRQNVAGIDGESIGESIANRWEGLEDGAKTGKGSGKQLASSRQAMGRARR